MAQEGIGRRAPLCSECNPPTASLDAEQHQAVEHILQSRDFVTLFRGGAGTGKSFTLLEVHKALRRDNRPVEVLAPQRQQVADLETDGFAGAQTVSAFLARRSVPRGAVVLVDEAGQIAQNLRRSPDHISTILIALTSDEPGEEVYSLGFNDAFKKPFDAVLLAERVRRLISQKKADEP